MGNYQLVGEIKRILLNLENEKKTMTENTDTHQPSPDNGKGKRKQFFKREAGQAVRSGVLLEKSFQQGKWGKQPKYVLETDTCIWSVDGYKDLDRQMDAIQVGDVVDLEYGRLEISPDGKKQHKYKVWKDEMIPMFNPSNESKVSEVKQAAIPNSFDDTRKVNHET